MIITLSAGDYITVQLQMELTVTINPNSVLMNLMQGFLIVTRRDRWQNIRRTNRYRGYYVLCSFIYSNRRKFLKVSQKSC